MSQSSESFVGIPPNIPNTTNKIRQFQMYEMQADGSFVPVLVEGVVLVDPMTGLPRSPISMDSYHDENLKLLRAIARGLEVLTGESLIDED